MSIPRPRLDSIKSQSSSMWGGRPASPTFSTTTTGSKINLPDNHSLITRKDLRQSIASFEELMAAAKAYRNALLAMSSATAAFATAMEACSRVKGCRSSNSALAGASGLQYLVSNHEQLLADTVYRQFEIPLLEALDEYKLVTADRLAQYEKSLHEQSQKIRKTEADNLKVGRRRKRDLQQFREALAELQRQVDDLDTIKASYHEEVLEGEDEVWETVLGRVAFVVRSQLDFYEKIAGKASDPILEPMVMSIPDPFDAYGPPKEEGQIFSVLAPLGLLDSSAPQSPKPRQSPKPGLPRTLSPTPASATSPGPPASPPPPADPQLLSPTKQSSSSSSISAENVLGQFNEWLDEGDEGEEFGRKSSRERKELSVIDETQDGISLLTSDSGEREDGSGAKG
ncbi:hypothetical protein IAR50_003275 [Cryptococcus sp. DSM 104548]